jgi:hypothetical protein
MGGRESQLWMHIIASGDGSRDNDINEMNPK